MSTRFHVWKVKQLMSQEAQPCKSCISGVCDDDHVLDFISWGPKEGQIPDTTFRQMASDTGWSRSKTLQDVKLSRDSEGVLEIGAGWPCRGLPTTTGVAVSVTPVTYRGREKAISDYIDNSFDISRESLKAIMS